MISEPRRRFLSVTIEFRKITNWRHGKFHNKIKNRRKHSRGRNKIQQIVSIQQIPISFDSK